MKTKLETERNGCQDQDLCVKASPAWVARLPAAREAPQLLVVAALGTDRSEALVSLHRRDEKGKWQQVLSTPGLVGRDGLCPDRDHVEGCSKTPMGVYGFNRAFGIAEDPGCTIPYTRVSQDSYWSCDDRKGMHYNEMVNAPDLPGLALEKCEHLIEMEAAYQYCLNISFNPEGTAGRGSAIFLHCMNPKRAYTEGCVAISESMMRRVMQQVREDCVVVIDTLENLGGSPERKGEGS